MNTKNINISSVGTIIGSNLLCACILGGARKLLNNRTLHTRQKPLEAI